ncbi:cellulose biosynthesis cyclic di-GMP-binding regulatory protein BcsB [Pelagibacterium sp.]|uniref:cellulose biosynthesis cyclic di-GMP-binding regulatory protein BcsB n=1 Tax=Pelagibacterium sp. TaxID=1967288 RepID=UPI003A8DCD22
MMRPLLASCLAAFVATPAFSQVPFDMSPELNLQVMPSEPEVAPPTSIGPVAPTPDIPTGLNRRILLQTGIRFEGEIGTRAFDFYLTAAQAAAPANLDMSVLNSIVVAPEYSEFTVTLNGTDLGTMPIAYAIGPADIRLSVPEGVLASGRNRIAFTADQRHRTDCSVESTYELWTEVYSAETVLELDGVGLGRLESLGELPAIGLGENGATQIQFFIPQIDTKEASTAALRLAQYLALALKTPAVDITLTDTLADIPRSGMLTVMVGTADALPAQLSDMAEQAAGEPVAELSARAELPNTLVVSGPDWAAIETATRMLVPAAQDGRADLGGMRSDLPDSVPVISGRTSVALSELGVETLAFNGRRYHTALRFALPSDFYANMYSEAELVLDAAYSSSVLPGSQLEIYVNGQIASVVPILRTDGGAFRMSRLRIPMTNFRPGINEMYIETVLLTDEDTICPPGLSGRAPARFLFSADSQLAVPDFGRIAKYPSLSALAGTGAPYVGANGVPVLVAEGPSSLQAAMMLMSRLALSSGMVIEADVVSEAALDPGAAAILVGPMGNLSPEILNRGRVVELDASGSLPVIGTGENALERWQEATGVSSGNMFENAQNWIAEQLNLAPENFWLFRRDDGAYLPQSRDAAVLSQVAQPEGGIWTMLTIPNDEAFVAATRRMISPANWQQVAGRVSAIGVEDETMLVLQPRSTILVPTQPLSFSNLRLVAANWMSTNVLGYALLLAGAVIFLTIATSLLLRAARRTK